MFVVRRTQKAFQHTAGHVDLEEASEKRNKIWVDIPLPLPPLSTGDDQSLHRLATLPPSPCVPSPPPAVTNLIIVLFILRFLLTFPTFYLFLLLYHLTPIFSASLLPFYLLPLFLSSQCFYLSPHPHDYCFPQTPSLNRLPSRLTPPSFPLLTDSLPPSYVRASGKATGYEFSPEAYFPASGRVSIVHVILHPGSLLLDSLSRPNPQG